jgi:leucyl-tRNA synthetase
VIIPIQINGKLKSTIDVNVTDTENIVQQLAKQAIAKWLIDKQIIKVIFVPGKLINFVVH